MRKDLALKAIANCLKESCIEKVILLLAMVGMNL